MMKTPGIALGFTTSYVDKDFKLGLSTFRVLVFPSKFPGFVKLIAFGISVLISAALAAEEAGIVLKI